MLGHFDKLLNKYDALISPKDEKLYCSFEKKVGYGMDI